MNIKNAIIELPEELTNVEIEWEVGQKFDDAGDGHTFFHFADGADKDGNKYIGTAEVVDGEVVKINDIENDTP